MTTPAGVTELCFPCRRPQPRCLLRVFCLPWAGAGASAFRGWDEMLGPQVEVCAFQSPGRETRFGEAPLTRLDTLVQQFLAASESLRDRPFVLLGHSFGAIVAAEAALRLVHGPSPPNGLVVIGCPAPSTIPRHVPIGHLPRRAFLQALCEFGGMEDAVVADDELVDLLLPGLRADCVMAESWRVDAAERFRHPLPCAVAAIAGSDDPYVSQSELEAWRAHGKAGVRVMSVPGDHFFLRTSAFPVFELLRERAHALMSNFFAGGC